MSLLSALITACGPALQPIMVLGPGEGRPANHQSGYVHHSPTNDVAIVFVHGVLGDGIGTWRNEQNGAYWPDLLMQDQTFDGASIFVFDYPSPLRGKAPSIDEAAEMLRSALNSARVTDHQRMVFVAHSMGGLVTRAYLLKDRQFAPRARMLHAFSTPATGSAVAEIARLISRNPQFRGMVRMESDHYLADQARNWLGVPDLAGLPSYCAYELQDTYGVRVVPMASAIVLCNRPPDPLNHDHLGVVKPVATNDQRHLVLRSAYEDALGLRFGAPRPLNLFHGVTSRPVTLQLAGTVKVAPEAVDVEITAGQLRVQPTSSQPNAGRRFVRQLSALLVREDGSVVRVQGSSRPIKVEKILAPGESLDLSPQRFRIPITRSTDLTGLFVALELIEIPVDVSPSQQKDQMSLFVVRNALLTRP